MSEELFDEIFGKAELIVSYSRRQAIEDGVLVDVTKTAEEAGFEVPVAMTCGAWSKTVKLEAKAVGDERGRLWDVLSVLKAKARRGSRVNFEVLVNGSKVALYAVCGPGDDAEPVITIMLIGED